MKKIAILVILTSFLAACSKPTTPKDKAEQLMTETVQDLKENVLPFWENYSIDPNGGFYGEVNHDGSPQTKAEKGGVLNARIIWTFSKAYELFKNEEHLSIANRAKEYFLEHFVDPEFGGTYWSINADGTPLNTDKQTYGIAFAIYGLAEHYNATGNEESLDWAIKMYNILEEHAYDPVNQGYIESFTREWEIPELFGYDGEGVAPKTMNTHLHVLEAYTRLYQVWPDESLRRQLQAVVDVFLTKIINQETWHEQLYLTMDWQNLNNIDSYGHDMELSWLLYDAAESLGDSELIEKMKHVVIKLVDTQTAEGWADDGVMRNGREDGELIEKIEWWPQAESVLAFFNAWEISGEEKYLDASIKTWEWIKANLIDYEHGEWFEGFIDGELTTKGPKISFWKCPYHNSRMAFELYERVQALQ